MPLNTLDARIDYAFYVIPLKNSACNIKVWIYKGNDDIDWYFRVV